MDLDERLRRFRLAVPPPRADAARTTARRAMEQSRARRTVRTFSTFGRPLRIGLAAAAVAGIAVVLVVLFVETPRPAGQTNAPRVAYGLEAVLRVEPDPGVTLDDATGRAVRALESRAAARDIAGLEIAPAGDGRMRVTVPGAKEAYGGVETLTTFSTLAVYDLSAVTLAESRNPSDLGPAIASSGIASTRPRAYVVLSRNGFPVIFETRAAVDEYLKDLGGTATGEVVALPAGLRIVTTEPTAAPRYILLRDEPVIRSGDIAGFRVNDGQLVEVEIGADAAARVDAAIQASLARNGPSNLVAVEGSGGGMGTQVGVLSERGFALSIDHVGLPRISFDLSDPARVLSRTSDVGIGARIVVEATQPYGEVPLPAGDHAPLPAWLEASRKRLLDGHSGRAAFVEVPRATIVRVLSTTGPSGEWTVWAGRAPDGTDAVWMSLNGEDRATIGCDPGLGNPALTSCGATGGSKDTLFIGRVNDEVASVGLETRGRHFDAVVKNGWYFAALPQGYVTPPFVLTAFAGDGRAIARIDRNGIFVRLPD